MMSINISTPRSSISLSSVPPLHLRLSQVTSESGPPRSSQLVGETPSQPQPLFEPRLEPNRHERLSTRLKFTKHISRRCAGIYKADKHYYIGLLKEFPPPSEVQQKWDEQIRPSLEQHLCQATRTLPKSLSDDDVITEPVLCMAGKLCPTKGSFLSTGDLVTLNPMIWIHCGSRKCKKKVIEVTRNLPYLSNFLQTFSLEAPHASLRAPWPAANGPRAENTQSELQDIQVSLAIQIPSSHSLQLFGAKIKFTIVKGSTSIERFCTIGGPLKVDSSIYGLTTAHGLVSAIQEVRVAETSSPMNISSEDEDNSSSSDPGSESESDQQHRAAPIPSNRTSARSAGEHDKSQSSDFGPGLWKPLPLPTSLSYLGRMTTKGNYDLPQTQSMSSDFALIDLSNTFDCIDPDIPGISWSEIELAQLAATCSGEVFVVVRPEGRPVKGYLLDGEASIILRGKVVRTRKIQIERTGGLLLFRVFG
jgi:hypothetical protein